jgi:hypothetical protein
LASPSGSLRHANPPTSRWTQRLQEKSFCLCRGSNLNRPAVQLIARHYTDWATRLIVYFSTLQ